MEDYPKGRGKIGAIQDNRIKDKEFAQRILSLGMQARNLGKLGKPKTVEEMEERIDTYLGFCVDAGLPPTVEGMCLSIDYDRVTVYGIEQQMSNVKFSNTVKRAKDFIASYDATLRTFEQTKCSDLLFPCKKHVWDERCSRN